MNNKEKIFLASLQETLKEFIKGDIGKAAKADLASLEKAVGGKKTLDRADKILVEVEQSRVKILADADKKALKIINDAVAEMETLSAALESDRKRLVAQESTQAKAAEALAVEAQELDGAMKAFKDRVKEVDDRFDTVVRDEGAVRAREDNATLREAEIKRKDDYYAGAPA